MFQLESKFAHEYSQNPDFKNFIDKQPGISSNFMEDGFESSRRGLNLEYWMKNNCHDELKEADKKNEPIVLEGAVKDFKDEEERNAINANQGLN